MGRPCASCLDKKVGRRTETPLWGRRAKASPYAPPALSRSLSSSPSPSLSLSAAHPRLGGYFPSGPVGGSARGVNWTFMSIVALAGEISGPGALASGL